MSGLAVAVAHHPAGHPYVLHIGGPRPDPVDAPPDVWDVDTLASRGVRVVHLHFGFEHLDVGELTDWVDRLRAAGIHLVHTVHDLDNPHLTDQRPFHRAIGVLADAAAALLTLTDAAAREVRARYRRDAIVVAHPPVVPLEDRTCSDDRRRDGVYVHAATLRPNLDLDLIGPLAVAARPVGGLHLHVRTTASELRRERLRQLATGSGAIVEVGRRLTDVELWQRLATARLVVLPYRWGTHSGLLEAAHDLGTPVLAPAFGGYGDQGAHIIDAADLGASVRRAIDAPPSTTSADRDRRRHASAVVHAQLYADLLGRAG